MIDLQVSPRIHPHDVEIAIARYWEALMSKSPEILQEFYTHNSTVFGTTAVRPEPGRLAVLRREREYFQSRGSMRATIGTVDVTPISDTAVVATYTFQAHATKVDPLSGKLLEEHIEPGRATHVFCLDHDGQLRMLHEHISVAVK